MKISFENETSKVFKIISTDLDIWESSIIIFIWVIIQVFGNGLLLGAIQYDRLGEDPLKRRISDQVFYI